VAPITIGIIVQLRFHIRCISIHKLLYFNFFSASFCTTFLSAGIYYYYYYKVTVATCSSAFTFGFGRWSSKTLSRHWCFCIAVYKARCRGP
jgi:hypothetical protein